MKLIPFINLRHDFFFLDDLRVSGDICVATPQEYALKELEKKYHHSPLANFATSF